MDELLSFDNLLEFNKNYKNPKAHRDKEYVLFLNDIYLGTAVPGKITIEIDSKSCEGIVVADFRDGAPNLNGSLFFAIVKLPSDLGTHGNLIKLPYHIGSSSSSDKPAGPILTNARVDLQLQSSKPAFRKIIYTEYKKIEDIKNAAVSAAASVSQGYAKTSALVSQGADQARDLASRGFGFLTSRLEKKLPGETGEKKIPGETGGRKRRTRRKRSTKSKRRRG